jgi:hypothetical protein
MVAAQGSIHGNTIGINVQAPDYDYSSISDSVTLRDNQRDLDAASLPLPDLPLPSGG